MTTGRLDSTKYNNEVANASASTVISSAIFKAFIADLYDKVNSNYDMLGQVISKSAAATLTTAEVGVVEITAAADFTITLPSAATTGLRYTLKKVDSGTGKVTIATTSSQTIDGVTTRILSRQNSAITVVSDGSNWKVASEDIVSLERYYAADVGTTDAYAITLSPAPTAYYDGMIVRFKANTDNTGAASLNVSSLGVIAIKKSVISDLDTGDILANQPVAVIYLGGNFHLMSPSSVPYLPLAGGVLTGNMTLPSNSTAGTDGIFGKSGAVEIWAIIRSNNDTNFRTFGQPLFNGLMIGQGTGSPEGVLTASVGALFRRTNGGAITTLYVKETGTGNTGWVAK